MRILHGWIVQSIRAFRKQQAVVPQVLWQRCAALLARLNDSESAISIVNL